MGSITYRSSIKKRLSGLELLKIIAVLLIVVSHVTQTLGTYDIGRPWGSDFYINLNTPTTDLSVFILILFRYLGHIGNTIFFTCSAYFLVDKKLPNVKKAISIIIDVFIVSILFLVPMLLIYGKDTIGNKDILRSLLPTIFANNWYITMYIVFIFISPILNILNNKMNKEFHLSILTMFFTCFFILGYFKHFTLSNNFTAWLTVYFGISYFKKYQQKFCGNTLLNGVLLLISVVGYISFLYLNNKKGVSDPNSNIQMLKWNCTFSFFNILIAFFLFNLFNKMKFTNKVINYLAGLSLFVYITHENILFRTHVRPLLWHLIYQLVGHNNMLDG